jgi:hypothetical protein
MAKGNFGRRKNVFTVAKNTVEKGLTARVRRPQAQEARVPRPVDPAHQRRSAPERHQLQRVHEQAEERQHQPWTARPWPKIAYSDAAAFTAIVNKVKGHSVRSGPFSLVDGPLHYGS